MKSVIALLIATLSLTAAFAPLQVSRSETQLNSLFDAIQGMDLFDSSKSKYGARKSKALKQGSIGKNSYVPAGLSQAEYNKIRKAEAAQKEKNYQKNVSKAFKFLPYDDFYRQRGTGLDFKWKSATNGHRMAKTKYDFSGVKDEQKKPEAFAGTIFGRK